MERKFVASPQIVVADKGRVPLQEFLHGFKGARPKGAPNRMAVDVGVLDYKIRANLDQILITGDSVNTCCLL